MGRLKFLILFISLFLFVGELYCETYYEQEILQELIAFRSDWAYVMERDAGTISELFTEILYGPGGFGTGADGVGIIGLNLKLEQLSEYLQTSLVDELDKLTSIYDLLQSQGGTKDDWQSLRDSLMSMEHNLYNLSMIQNDTSTMSSSVYSLLNEVQNFNSTLISKLDSMQETSSSDYNNLFLTLESKLDQVINAVDQFRYFDFNITADVDFQPVIEYLKDISDNGVKINGFDGNIYVTNNVDLSEIIKNQEKQIDFNDSYSDFLGMNYNRTLEDYIDHIRYGETGDWEDSSIAGIVHHLEELTEVLTEGGHDTEITPVESVASEFLDGGDYYATQTTLFAEGATNYLHKLDFEPEQLEYDFSNYTNVTDVVQGLNDDYYFIKLMSTTNQFTSASETITESITSQFNKLTPLFERNYSSTIKIDWAILGDSPKTIDLSQYVTFSSSGFRTCWDFVIWVTSILFGYKMLKSIWEN